MVSRTGTRTVGPRLPRAAEIRPGETASADDSDVRTLEARLDEITDSYSSGEIDKRAWLRSGGGRGQAGGRDAARLARSAQDRARLALPRNGELRGSWPTLTLSQRRAVVEAVVEQVIGRPAAQRGPTFDPGRVELRWLAFKGSRATRTVLSCSGAAARCSSSGWRTRRARSPRCRPDGCPSRPAVSSTSARSPRPMARASQHSGPSIRARLGEPGRPQAETQHVLDGAAGGRYGARWIVRQDPLKMPCGRECRHLRERRCSAAASLAARARRGRVPG